MKNSFFSKILGILFLFVGFSGDAQIRVKTHISNKNIVKKHRQSFKGGVRVKNKNPKTRVIGKNHLHRVVIKKPKRPTVIVKRPNYKRPGYIWVEGYWQWNAFYGKYTWKQARWKKIKKNHLWTPGFWQVGAAGFFWVEGYWEREF